jgi:SAM-dependent methyltransferase
MAPVGEKEMRSFWNARAREDAFYFVDTRQQYGSPDIEHFWDAAPLIDYMLDGLGVRISTDDVVLEIGCGIGRMTRVLAARAREVVAVDVSDQMLARAKELNVDLVNVRWTLGDGASLAGIADQSIDACISVLVFQHIPDPRITLAYVIEVGRVLRTGGWATLQVSNNPAAHTGRNGWRPRGWRYRLRALAGRGPRGMHHPAWVGSAVELDALRRAAAEASLEVERVWGEGSTYCHVLLRKT